MRVVHVDTAREWRGGQTQLLHLATAMPGSVVCLPADARLRPALEAAGVEVRPVPFRGALRGTATLRAIVRREAPCLIAAHTSHAHGHALRCGRTLVVHRRLDFPLRRWSRRKYAQPAGYVAVSQAVHEVLVRGGVAAHRIAVVLDGVEIAPLQAARPDPLGVRASLGLAATDRVALAVGALVDHKGHRHLVQAMPHLPGWHVIIAGEGPRRRALTRLARRLGVEARLHLVGQRTDVPRLLKSVDVVVHPSVEEGMGQAVAEALVAGARVVCTDAGGLPEVMGSSGIVVRRGSPGALAAGIRAALLEGPGDPAGLAVRFSVERMVRETLAAYRRVLDRSDAVK